MWDILAKIAIGVGIASLLTRKTSNELTEFTGKNIVTDFHKFFDSKEETEAKKHATRSINKIVAQCKDFKIGKSGVPQTRKYAHSGFDKLYVIIESLDGDFIDELESHYNEKFFDNPKNVNKKKGSAGVMTDEGYGYFLYVVVNE